MQVCEVVLCNNGSYTFVCVAFNGGAFCGGWTVFNRGCCWDCFVSRLHHLLKLQQKFRLKEQKSKCSKNSWIPQYRKVCTLSKCSFYSSLSFLSQTLSSCYSTQKCVHACLCLYAHDSLMISFGSLYTQCLPPSNHVLPNITSIPFIFTSPIWPSLYMHILRFNNLIWSIFHYNLLIFSSRSSVFIPFFSPHTLFYLSFFSSPLFVYPILTLLYIYLSHVYHSKYSSYSSYSSYISYTNMTLLFIPDYYPFFFTHPISSSLVVLLYLWIFTSFLYVCLLLV